MATNTRNCSYTRPVLGALCILPHLIATISYKIGIIIMFLVHSRYLYLIRKALLLFQTLGTPPLGLDCPRAIYIRTTAAGLTPLQALSDPNLQSTRAIGKPPPKDTAGA